MKTWHAKQIRRGILRARHDRTCLEHAASIQEDLEEQAAAGRAYQEAFRNRVERTVTAVGLHLFPILVGVCAPTVFTPAGKAWRHEMTKPERPAAG